MNLNALDGDTSAVWLIDSCITTSYTRILNALALLEILIQTAFFPSTHTWQQSVSKLFFSGFEDSQETWVLCFFGWELLSFHTDD